MNRSAQSGNVIFIILLGIALFAALSYAVNRSMRNSGDTGGKEKADIQISEILTYANSLSTAVKALKANGCLDTQISFENPKVTGYTNASAPSDKTCHVFSSEGGGLSYIDPNKDILDSKYSALIRYGQWYITGRYCVNYVGTGDASCTAENSELILILPYLKKSVCERLMSVSGQTSTEPTGNTMVVPFIGTYGTSQFATANADRKLQFCNYYTGGGAWSGSYAAYMVLLPR